MSPFNLITLDPMKITKVLIFGKNCEWTPDALTKSVTITKLDTVFSFPMPTYAQPCNTNNLAVINELDFFLKYLMLFDLFQ